MSPTEWIKKVQQDKEFQSMSKKQQKYVLGIIEMTYGNGYSDGYGDGKSVACKNNLCQISL